MITITPGIKMAVDDDIDLGLTVGGTGSSSGAVTSVDGKTGAVQILPVGGTTGQVLAKASATSYDVEWVENGGSVDPADIAAAIEAYLVEHPITESDPTVPSWAKASTKPSYTAAEVGAIAAPSSPASGAFLVWNGSAWVAQTLATWQGGAY